MRNYRIREALNLLTLAGLIVPVVHSDCDGSLENFGRIDNDGLTCDIIPLYAHTPTYSLSYFSSKLRFGNILLTFKYIQFSSKTPHEIGLNFPAQG